MAARVELPFAVGHTVNSGHELFRALSFQGFDNHRSFSAIISNLNRNLPAIDGIVNIRRTVIGRHLDQFVKKLLGFNRFNGGCGSLIIFERAQLLAYIVDAGAGDVLFLGDRN